MMSLADHKNLVKGYSSGAVRPAASRQGSPVLTSRSTSMPPLSFDQNSCPPNWELLLEASDTASAAWSWAMRGSARGLELVGVPAQELSLLSDLAGTHDVGLYRGARGAAQEETCQLALAGTCLMRNPQAAWGPALDGRLVSTLTSSWTMRLSLYLVGVPAQE